ncbi:hypothetical protein EVAR_51607_1 [Eumeta japonica]|uniref:non-specific serine/threonine protein kinase n=1 Tax=Eumeta variegata TaxID=151549 RepID=A0A4C1YFD6_EUMVA|nr:hypothetical protein EVAR_51607_1 [Eumeta japonica]
MLLIEKEKKDTNAEVKWLDSDNLQIVMIDFGLAQVSSSPEDKGVDLYVLERALISTHNDFPDLFKVILNSYKNYSKTNTKEILAKFEEVRARGRKRTMIG